MLTNKKIIGILIAIAFIFIVGIVTRYTAAVDVLSTTKINNEAPAVDTIRFATTAYGADNLTSTGILPSVGTTTTIHINGTIRDYNGDTEIASSSMSLIFHKTSATNTCTEDKNDCYKIITGCTVDYTYGSDEEVAYNCPVDIAYWIDATDAASIFSLDNWTAHISVQDQAGLTAVRDASIEVQSLLALTIPSAIEYGNRMLDEKSTEENNIHMALVQAGNTKADVEVKGGIMTCDIYGILATSSQAWALDDVGYATSTLLTDSFVITHRNIDLRIDDANEHSKNLYWNVAIPPFGVKGRCTGYNTIVIVSNIAEESTSTISYLVSTEQGENTTITPSSRTVTEGNTTTFAVSASSGYTVSASGCAGVLVGSTYTTGPITADCTVTTIATVTPPEEATSTPPYIVSVSQGTSTTITPNESRTVNQGETLTFEVSAEAHYTASVIGCAGTLVGSTYTTGLITADCTVKTTAIPETYLVTYDGNGNTGGSVPTNQLKTYNKDLVLRANSGSLRKTAYTLAGWNTSPDGTGTHYPLFTYYTENAPLALYAEWIDGIYNVTTDGTNVTFTPASSKAGYEDIITFTVTPSTGYNLTSITGCSGTLSGNTYTTGPITGNCRVDAAAVRETYPVTYNSNGAATGTVPISQTKEYGIGLTLQTNTGKLGKPTYTFMGWNTAPDGTGTHYATSSSYTVNEPVELYAEWALNTYLVSTSGDNANFTPTSPIVSHGATTTLTITAKPGYILTGVTGCSGTLSSSTYTTGVITAPCTVTAATVQPVTTIAYSGGPYDQTGLIKNQGGYYRVVTIGTQTWMKDNMNIGSMLPSVSTNPTNNSIIEKWCYGNDGGNCNNDGGLYHWNEVMQYVTTSGAQGICPAGWHVPTDAEYKTLELFLGMTQQQVDTVNYRGTDQGTKLKEGGTSGFEARMSGFRHQASTFSNINTTTYFWTSTRPTTQIWMRHLDQNRTTVERNLFVASYGLALRCLKN